MAKRRGIVEHHVFYPHTKPGNKRQSQREITQLMYNDEHQVIWRIQNRVPERMSKGFWRSLRVIMEAYEPFAHEVENGKS